MKGVDTVGVAFPIRDADLAGPDVTTRGVAGRPPSSWRRELPDGGWLAGGVGGMAWIEANLPKRRDGSNVHPITDSEVVAAVRDCIDSARVFVEPGPEYTGADGATYSVDNPKITRLDLVRDFRLTVPERLAPMLDALERVPRSGRLTIRKFANGRTGRTETLRVGPGAWAATLYDKCSESDRLAQPGHLRFEVRLRSRQLRSSFTSSASEPIRTLEDVTPERLDAIRRAWFSRARFDVPCGDRDVWDELASSGMSDREKMYFVGWLSARRAGRDMHVSPTTARRFRQLAGSIETGAVGVPSVRLDYEEGLEVDCRAA